MGLFGAGARVAGGGADGAQAFKAGRTTAAGFKMGEEVLDISQMGALLKKMDGKTFTVALDNPGLVKFLDEANPEDLMTALKGMDSKKLANIGEQMDPKTIDALKKVDGGADLADQLKGGADLAKKGKPSTGVVARAGEAGASFSKAFIKKMNKASKSLKKYISGAPNIPTPPNVPKAAKELVPPGGAANASVEEVGGKLASTRGGKLDDATNAVSDTANVLEDGSKSSKSLKKALGELGITPGSVAIGAGVIVLLCMAYDTDNPFTAVDRALDDTGKVVKGFKEVADSAATAAKDVTTGGFDFISFVSNNSWISFACSILCVILLFALFMMGMLGSMGGNNKR